MELYNDRLMYLQQLQLVLFAVLALLSFSECTDDSLTISPSVRVVVVRRGDDLQEDEKSPVDSFSSRMGRPETRMNDDDNASNESVEKAAASRPDRIRGLLPYKNVKTHYTREHRVVPSSHHHHDDFSSAPLPPLGPPAYQLPRKHHHHHHYPHRKPKVPHYVKYWEQNHPHHHHHHGGWGKKKKHGSGWKVYHKPSPFSRGYLTDLAERLADGVGLLPEYGHSDHKPGPHKHGKYHFKGITLHNGFFTEVI
jgi:hypothetical protein